MAISTPTSGPIIEMAKLHGYAESVCLPEPHYFVATWIVSALKSIGGHPSVQGIVQMYESTSPGSSLRVFAAEALQYSLTKDKIYYWTTAELIEV